MKRANFPNLSDVLVAIGIVCGTGLLLSPLLRSAYASSQRRLSPDQVCLSNLRQLGAAVKMYCQDYDDILFPLKTRQASPFAGSEGVSNNAAKYTFFSQLLYPYTKSWVVWRCPDNPLAWVNQERSSDPKNPVETVADYQGYGGQNSYGANAYLFPEGAGRRRLEVDKPERTLLLVDARYYSVLPQNPPALEKVATKGEYASYWKNLGNAYFYRAGGEKPAPLSDEEARKLGGARHSKKLNLLCLDGHVETLPYAKVASDTTRWLP